MSSLEVPGSLDENSSQGISKVGNSRTTSKHQHVVVTCCCCYRSKGIKIGVAITFILKLESNIVIAILYLY